MYFTSRRGDHGRRTPRGHIESAEPGGVVSGLSQNTKMAPAALLFASLLPLVTLSLPCASELASCTAPWEFAGPAGYRGLDPSEDDPTGIHSAGAAQSIVADEHGSWFLGSVNGGVWRTRNVSAVTPHWEPVTDEPTVPCSSISALATAPGRVFAGCGGSTSSEMGADWNSHNTGDWGGVMMSADGGTTWSHLSGFPPNYYVAAVTVLPDVLLVAARSNFFDRDDGGIWRSDDGGQSFTRVLDRPAFALHVDATDPDHAIVIAALPFPTADSAAVVFSDDGGRSFPHAIGAGIAYRQTHAPFYPCLALAHGFLYYGALTVSSTDATDTNSVIYRRRWPVAAAEADPWEPITGGPDPDGSGLDDDAMPKDRMALLPHPHDASLLFVAGNGDKIAYRVHIDAAGGGGHTASWTSMTGNDTASGAAPHCDCRNLAWDEASGSLLLTSDGGIFRRTNPEAPGGEWLSANGDYAAMEFLSATWDWRANRWVAGAQDNDVQVAPRNAIATSVAAGIVLGDGMVTAVDSASNPSRLWGTRQFLGSRRADMRRRRRMRRLREWRSSDDGDDDGDDDDDDDDGDDDFMPGFCFTQGDNATDLSQRVCLDTALWGFTPEAFPFFMHPYAPSGSTGLAASCPSCAPSAYATTHRPHISAPPPCVLPMSSLGRAATRSTRTTRALL